MTEADWLACDNPHFARCLVQVIGKRTGRRSRRKDRLAAVAGLRHVWADLSAEQRQAIVAAERYADGEILYPELRAATVSVGGGEGGKVQGAVAVVTHREVAIVLSAVTTLFLPVVVGGPVYTTPPFPEARAFVEQGRPFMAILRCIFGNPFRSVTPDPAWRTSTALSLARAAYDEREVPEARLSTAHLAVLSDALEDAGCDDAELLGHLRSPGPHARGCWALDVVLGKQ